MTTIEDRHRLACILGEPTYEDPTTGYRVMTRPALLTIMRVAGTPDDETYLEGESGGSRAR